jgi:hypothetical protein
MSRALCAVRRVQIALLVDIMLSGLSRKDWRAGIAGQPL